MQERAVLYARISLDKTGEEIGVTRQLGDLRKLAADRGWDVVDECVDNDITASKGLRREGYERVWELVRAGAVDHVVVWQSSRLMRSRADRAQVISEFGKRNVDIVAAKGPSFDLRSAYGRLGADIMSANDTVESEIKSERVTAAVADLAQRGKGWGFCPYGWDRTGGGYHAHQVINEHEANIVRELAAGLLAGKSLAELTRAMNDRGEPSPGWAVWAKQPPEVRAQRADLKGRKEPSKVWARSTVRMLLRRDCNVGVRRYRSKHGDGIELPGDWEPIIDRTKHDRITALLSNPERRTHSGPRPGARRHLLTAGIGECGVCGGPLRVWRRRYLCESNRHCVGRIQTAVDDLVGRVVIGRMQKKDALDWLMGDDEHARQLTQRCDEMQRRLDEAAVSQAAGRISTRALELITAELEPQLITARRERDTALRNLDVEELRKLAGPKAAERWEEMSVTQRRAVLQTIGLEAVVILPRTLHGPGFEADRIKFMWRKRTR
jgi:site-specific DNA recombinase